MIANYHTHTHRCNHAVGREEEYVRQAIGAGMEVLGWADHTPYIFPNGYYSNFRMRPIQLGGYVQTLEELRRQYQDKLRIHIGLETEYYPKHFAELLAFLRDYPIEYMILGQHFIGNEYDALYCGLMTQDKEVVRQYCRQSMAAMNTGLFTYFAHPDVIHYSGDWNFFRETVRPMCREAKNLGVPLEINLLGLGNRRHYPNRIFWEVAAEEGCQAILGCDAHAPQMLDVAALEQSARKMASELGLTVLDTVPLRSIHK